MAWDLIHPLEPVSDQWFAASGFRTVLPPSRPQSYTPEQQAVLRWSTAVTREAQDAAARGEHWALARAAGLHVLAAELRREAGAWTECGENFTALARYYVDMGQGATAESYVRKLLFVSEFSADDAVRAEAYAFVATLDIELGKFDRALAMAKRAVALTECCSDPKLRQRVADLTARFTEESVAKGLGRRMQPAWKPTPAPLEFRLRGVPFEPDTTPGGWSSASLAPGSGIDLLMRKPGAAGECRYWVSHRITGGSHQVVVLPNWPGRAMQAAKVMLELSKKDPEDTAAPSSAVLQVSCALEAFINSVVHFIRALDKGCWTDAKLPDYCFSECNFKQIKVPTIDIWLGVTKGLFGPDWVRAELIDDFRLLNEIRDVLVHFKGDNEEQVLADGSKTPKIFSRIAERIKPRRAPAAWIDRVLTRDLATWAVGVGERLIAEFRAAWEVQQQAEAGRISDHIHGSDLDKALEQAVMSPDLEALRRQDTLVAEFLNRARSRASEHMDGTPLAAASA